MRILEFDRRRRALETRRIYLTASRNTVLQLVLLLPNVSVPECLSLTLTVVLSDTPSGGWQSSGNGRNLIFHFFIKPRVDTHFNELKV